MSPNTLCMALWCGGNVVQLTVDMCLDHVDDNDDGEISLDEFRRWFVMYQQQPTSEC